MSDWSKILKTNDAFEAQQLYILNPGVIYHGYGHILDCYDYLEQNDVEYDEDLDYAVLYHDIVYDDQPNKERRSADLLLEHFPDKKDAAEIIMLTATHSIIDQDWRAIQMIKADLHQLMDPVLTLNNYIDIMRESEFIYGITPLEFVKSNRKYMNKLHGTIFDNYLLTGDEFWNKVNSGIELTNTISCNMISMYENLEKK
jgi:predicted metal-dependent HD superfamily phosphohydrolase